jgi:hypothetical protein
VTCDASWGWSVGECRERAEGFIDQLQDDAIRVRAIHIRAGRRHEGARCTTIRATLVWRDGRMPSDHAAHECASHGLRSASSRSES